MKILIAGGGIGGLSAALCAVHFGHDVTVFEQAPELSEIGAGIQIPPNAMKVFAGLGIEKAIAKNAFAPEAIELRMGESGRNIFTLPLAQTAIKRWGAPYLHIHRADYIDALKETLKRRAPKALRLGAAVTSYENTADGIAITLESEERISGDVLIGADGIKSGIRAQMLGPEKPRFTGNMAWRVVVPIADLEKQHIPNPTACAWMGKGRHAVTYRLRRGTLANFVGVVETNDVQDISESWTEQGRKQSRKDDALSDFAGWHPVITNIIKAAPPESFYRWALYDRPPLPRWVDGAAVLLGDAAHPMLPFMAQGAAMAVEDAWVLAQRLSEQASIPEALTAYQNQRLPRTSKAQAASRANMKTFHQRSKFGQFTSYAPMWAAARLLPSAVQSRMDWIYGFDVIGG